MNPFLRSPQARRRTPILAVQPDARDVEGAVVMRLYEPLDSWGGEWGVSSTEFAAALDQVPRDTAEIRLLINSPGGEVWEGLAVLNSLRSHPAKVVAVVEGIAASAASFIAAGVDELHIMKNAELFIHNAWGLCVGNAADMTKMAADLAHEDRNIASIYADKASGQVDDWLASMAAETWYSAEEAVTAGLADRVIDPKNDGTSGAANARARFDLSVFAQHGRAEKPRAVTKPPAEPADTTTPMEGADMASDTLTQGLRARLGIKADAQLDDDGLLAAVDEALNEGTQASASNTAAAPPAGTVLVEESVLADLRAKAEDGATARAHQVAAARAAIVDEAVTDGRISPARREHWLNALNADHDGAAATLASLEKGLMVPVQALGYTGGVSEAADDDRAYPKAWAAQEKKGGA